MHYRFLLALFVLMGLLLSACSADPVRSFAIRPVAQSTPLVPGNRIVVQSFNGNIFTVNPDGSNRVNLTTDARRGRQYQQPTWSPTAESVAFARVDALGNRVLAALVTAVHDGSSRAELAVPFPPFYLNWSPTGSQIAFLSNWMGLEGPSMALRLYDVANNSVDTLAEGSPYYFSWSPDGANLLAHIGENRLEIQSAQGERTALMNTAAGFGAPQWASDGDRIVYAVEDGLGQNVVIDSAEGGSPSVVTDFDERISFGLSPTGDRLAYVLTPTASQVNTLGPLYVTDIATRRTRELTGGPVWAFFWSPDGAKLAWLAIDQSTGRLWLRWQVWDGAKSTTYARFLPTRVFLERYLAFSDQYAQSMRIWSPDSSRFVYTGTDENERPGVWVQSLEGGAPDWIAAGVFAAWSPQ